MKQEYHRPNDLLADIVRTVLVIDGSRDADEHAPPIFTNGMPTLFCKTKTDRNSVQKVSQVALFSMAAPANYWSVDESTSIVAYFFKPFALSCLFKVDARSLSKGLTDLDSWSPHRYNALKTQLLYADTIPKKIEVLDNLLIHQLSENKSLLDIIHYATETMMLNPSNEVLTEIMRELALNERTFQRTFKKYVGITATHYRRISQFQLSFDHLRSKEYEKVSDVAFDNGFADQSHFIRSFKEFTDTTPNDYLQNGLTPKK